VSSPTPRALFAAALLGALLAAPLSAPLGAAPGDGTDPARARVAAQCAAFWAGAGRPDRAAAFRALSEAAGGDHAFTTRFIERTRPAMARLSAERATSPRAALLWARHAALCGGAADEE
jgi:hypothetical protein